MVYDPNSIHSESSYPNDNEHDHDHDNAVFSSPTRSYSDLAFHRADSPSPIPKKLNILPSQQVSILLHNLNYTLLLQYL